MLKTLLKKFRNTNKNDTNCQIPFNMSDSDNFTWPHHVLYSFTWPHHVISIVFTTLR
jgi:hypothetical protein